MGKYTIQRWKQTITIPDEGTTATLEDVSLNGKLVGIMSDVPQMDGTTTLTIAITDSEGYVLFSKASIAENAKFAQFVDANNHPLSLPMSGLYDIAVTASNAQTTAAVPIPVVLLIDKG